mmetsp:Transcript_22005/g.24445  ORF Transcript_22005/g.24445 Transcript_22005/m.24445 type:complete len:146 (+) Transcript_22005:13-450(+)
MVRQENDEDLPSKIRPIQLVMHNPNIFWVSPFNTPKAIEVVGGAGTVLSAGLGAGVAVTYYRFGQASIPATFYANVFKTWGRVVFGLAIGGYIGYLRFGDRQKLHNAYTSYRLRRRYGDSARNITETDIWQYKGKKCNHAAYEWQ